MSEVEYKKMVILKCELKCLFCQKAILHSFYYDFDSTSFRISLTLLNLEIISDLLKRKIWNDSLLCPKHRTKFYKFIVFYFFVKLYLIFDCEILFDEFKMSWEEYKRMLKSEMSVQSKRFLILLTMISAIEFYKNMYNSYAAAGVEQGF